MKLVIATLSIILAFLFSACTDSDEYLHNISDTLNVTVSASMTRSLDSSSRMVKADTIHPDDTLIFLADVTPTKTIKLQKYFWLLDGKDFSSEFSVRKPVVQIGTHRISFSLIDYFGDTLSDTLQLWVGNSPILDSKNFIPSNGSQGIPASENIQFAWHAYDPDSIYSLYYRFVLTDFYGDTLTDTLVQKGNFTQNNLKPLQKYNWKVQAFNELGMESNSTITGSLFTKGTDNKSGLVGKIYNKNIRSSLKQNLDIIVLLLDSQKKIVEKVKVQGNTKDSTLFNISSITAGKYQLTLSIPDAPDFVSDTIDIELTSNEVSFANTISFQDSIPPQIENVSGKDIDTLNFADTLYFRILDKGGSLSEDRIQVYLENEPLSSFLKTDLLSVFMPEKAKSWNIRLLNISAMDPSGNTAIRTFYIRPSVFWFDINNDTTIYADEPLQIVFHDRNPYSFTPKTLFLELGQDNPISEIKLNGKKDYTFSISTKDFTEGDNLIKFGIEYTNGISQWISRTFTLTNRKQDEND